MIKLLYLEKRPPSLTRDGFIKRWRKHGALGMSTAFWRHALVYVQAESITATPIPGVSEEFDAVAYLGYGDAAFSEPFTARDSAEAAMMLKDEDETFAVPTTGVSFWLEEERFKDAEPGGVTAFLFFNDAAVGRQVAEHYTDAGNVNRVVMNKRRNDIQLGSFNLIYPYQAVVEVSAVSLDALKQVLSKTADAWKRSDLAVVAREAVLWDRLSSH
jgi:hypothetical protein